MDLDLTPEEAEFCAELRAFIRENLPEEVARKVAADQWLTKADFLAWEHALARKGWLAYTWSAEDGGPGWTPIQQFLFWMITGEMNCPTLTPFGIKMVGPVLCAFGTEAQKARHLPGVLNSTTWWCQGYSEPGSGSDLASLSLKAERRDDSYILDGSKIWTSSAHFADWMFALVRTSREDRPQKGISFLLIDMTSPGIEVGPIRFMDGHHHFNQVFFDGVEVPAENLVGEEGQGWSIAKYLLGHERLEVTYLDVTRRGMEKLKRACAEAEAQEGEPLPEALRLRVARAEIRLRALQAQILSVLRGMKAGGAPGPEVSALKITGSELYQDILELIWEVAGLQGLAMDREILAGADPEGYPGPDWAATAAGRHLSRRAVTILGGTTEIQKNILAKNVLRL